MNQTHIRSIIAEEDAECPTCGNTTNRKTGDRYNYFNCYNSECRTQLFTKEAEE